MAGFLNFTGAAAAADLGIGSNPALPTDMAEDEIKRKRKQLTMMSQVRRGGNTSQTPGLYGAAGATLLGGM